MPRHLSPTGSALLSSEPSSAGSAVPAAARPGDRAASWPVWGLTASVVVTDPAALAEARQLTEGEVAATDSAASRFRPDSELSRINAAAGGWVAVSAVMVELLRAALRAAEQTDGAVDPTLGTALRRAGYDRDITVAGRTSSPVTIRYLGPRWRDVELDAYRGAVRIPPGVELDLGATAKAVTADRAAASAAAAVGGPVLVNLGGDLAVAGCGDDQPFPVVIAEDHRSTVGPVIRVGDGGVATSTTRLRRWTGPDGPAHHLLDPATGLPTAGPWRTATVAADSCGSANTASTASIVLGHRAPRWLAETGLPGRLVGTRGTVLTLNGWPEDT